MNKISAFIRNVICSVTLICAAVALTIFASADGGNGTPQLSQRLPWRLDLHCGMVSSGNLQLYKDEACTIPAIGETGGAHYACPGDWVIKDGEDNPAVTYPITMSSENTPDAGHSYGQYYAKMSEWNNYVADGPGNFGGNDWDENTWWNHLPSVIQYRWQGANSDDYSSPVYVSNNVGFGVLDDANGYYRLITSDGSSLVMSASMGEDCFYGYDPVNMDYTWNCTSSPWSTDGLKQGSNTVYYAGMDSYGNYLIGSRGIKWDTLAPIIKTNLKTFMDKHNGWINAGDLGEQYKISAQDDTSQTRDISGLHEHSLRYKADNNDWSNYQPFSLHSSDITAESSNSYDIQTLATQLGEGKHSLTLGIFDNAGNHGTTQLDANVDTVAPTCTPSLPAGSWTYSDAPIKLDFEDAMSGVATAQYEWTQSTEIPTGGWKDYNAGTELTPPGSENWYLHWQATDVAGNTGSGTFGPYSTQTPGPNPTPPSSGGVVIQTPNAGYLTDSDVVTSAYVYDNSSTPIVPTDNAVVSFSVVTSDGYTCTVQSKAVVCPSSDSSLVWFKWHTPKTPCKVTMTAYLSAPGGSSSNSLVWNVSYPFENLPPDPKATDRMPTGFTVTSPPYRASMPSASWSTWRATWIPDWEWHSYLVWISNPNEEGGGHYEDNGYWEDDGKWQFYSDSYHANLVSSLDIKPDSHSPTAKGKSMKSGYGLTEKVNAWMSSNESDAITAVQSATSYYPEFNYETYNRNLQQTSGGVFELAKNIYSIYKSRVHFTPVDFPDGNYTVQAYAYNAWSPAGMLSGYSTSTLNLKGSAYDDWYVHPGA